MNIMFNNFFYRLINLFYKRKNELNTSEEFDKEIIDILIMQQNEYKKKISNFKNTTSDKEFLSQGIEKYKFCYQKYPHSLYINEMLANYYLALGRNFKNIDFDKVKVYYSLALNHYKFLLNNNFKKTDFILDFFIEIYTTLKDYDGLTNLLCQKPYNKNLNFINENNVFYNDSEKIKKYLIENGIIT